MRITKLSLTNFRSFKETQTIEFAPVTLLFGPNSVGKSSVLLSLFYLQEILDKGHCNPLHIEALGNKYIGGFKHLVNGKNTSNRIVIKVEFEKSGIGSTYTNMMDIFGDEVGLYISSPATEAKNMALEFEIAWSNYEEQRKQAYVAAYRIWFDGIKIAELQSDSSQKQPMIEGLNYLHPLLLDSDYDSVEEAGVGSYLHGLLNCRASHLEKTIVINGEDFNHNPIGFEGFSGALPKHGSLLKTTDLHDDDKTGLILNELLTELTVSPIDNLLQLLKQSLCIGPLREIPDSVYQTSPYVSQSDWYSGKACWDQLATNKLHLVTPVNKWLSGKGGFDLGYELIYEVTEFERRMVRANTDIRTMDDVLALKDAVGAQIAVDFSRENPSKNAEAERTDIPEHVTQDIIKQQSSNIASANYLQVQEGKESKLVLWDINSKIGVAASDIGVGVSQLLPLVVAAVSSRFGLIACEQPELHVHPRVQVAIGDLLTQKDGEASFLIETHSEHLILRILKRIRQTTDGELPEGFAPVQNKDVSIVYLEASEGGVKSRRIHIDEDGEFEERWPNGFFAERREELM